MKIRFLKKKPKGIAERKTETKRQRDIPYKAVSLGVLMWLAVTWLFFGRGIVPHINITEGEEAPATVEALVDFQCENLYKTDLARKQAAKQVPMAFRIDPQPIQRTVSQVQALFDRLNQYAAASEEMRPTTQNSFKDLLMGSGIEPSTFIEIFPTNTAATVKSALIRELNRVGRTGIMSDSYRDSLATTTQDSSQIILLEGKKSTLNDVYSVNTAIESITENIEDPAQTKLLKDLLKVLLKDNISYDRAATEAAKKAASDQIVPVMDFYRTGTILIRAGEVATPQVVHLLQQHAQKRMDTREVLEQIKEILGNSILLLIGVITTAVILRISCPKLVRQPDKLLLMIILSMFTLGVARLLSYLSVLYPVIGPYKTYLIPHALAVLLSGILLGGSAALALGFWTSFATAVLFDQSFLAFALGMLITITAASTGRNVHRRSSLFRAGLWVCAVKVAVVLVAALLRGFFGRILLFQTLSAVASGILATILTLLLIPLFEKLFKITTDITLLELSDMGHPLLQKMAMQAPGTYHHSLMVATLAQNAAEAIGANSLLVRVCAYYHDIGKMAKPEFFTENIQHTENPHDELSPHMSALVISSHVKEGITLAKRHKLPQPILDAIEQHHGNGLISFFYHKAKSQVGDGTTTMADLINESDFRYGGAPAVTPEMAILSLADASEAASRSIEKPTPQKISKMLDDIFANKIRDGQMDYANLTMAEIKVVKQSFIFSLSNMLHGRIPYPKDNENNDSKSADKTSRPASKVAKAD